MNTTVAEPVPHEIIRAKAEELASSIGGVHLYGADLTFHIDAMFPTLTTQEFLRVREQCGKIADEIRFAALKAMWETV